MVGYVDILIKDRIKVLKKIILDDIDFSKLFSADSALDYSECSLNLEAIAAQFLTIEKDIALSSIEGKTTCKVFIQVTRDIPRQSSKYFLKYFDSLLKYTCYIEPSDVKGFYINITWSK